MKKIKRLLYTFVKGEALTVVCGIVVFLIIKKYSDIDKNGIDLGVLLSMIIMAVLTIMVFLMRKIMLSWLEDSGKLTEDYEELTKAYNADFVVYKNSGTLENNFSRRKYKKYFNQECKFPIICDKKFYEDSQISDFCIEDKPKKIYRLPQLIEDNFDEIMKAHSASEKYNQLCVRVDKWRMEKEKFVMHTSRTTYYDTLVTNRAMDFKWKNGMTVRERYFFGPFIPELKHSVLSNHLGCNGFIETADGYISLVKRTGTTTVAKHVYGGSFGMVPKIRHMVEPDKQKLKDDGILRSVKEEICEKYNLSGEEMERMMGHVVAAYRDIVEGGKPQLLFYIKLNVSKDDIKERLKRRTFWSKGKAKNGKALNARKLRWIHKEELGQLCILPNAIIYGRKKYSTVPAVAASLVMTMEYLEMNE